jgi:hypothetical protein
MLDSYTLEEAAAQLGIREDTLTATLPEIGVDLAARSPQTLTAEEFGKILEVQQQITAMHDSEGIDF